MTTKVTRNMLNTSIDDNGNATAITIDSSENVGIGSTSPDSKLHVESTGVTTLRIRTSSSSSEPQMLMIDGAGDYFSMQKVDRGMTFKPQGAEAMRIDSSGNVGIGDSNPGAKLDVNTGTVNTLAHFHSTDDNAFIELKDDDTTGYIGVQDDYVYVGGAPSRNDQNIVIHKTSGNVGISWIAPNARLGILQNGSTTPGMNITDGASADFLVYAGYVSGTTRIGSSAGALAIQSAGTERMRISGDNVLIKTTDTGQNSGSGVKFVNTRLYMVNALTSGEQISYYGNGGYKYYVGVNGKIHSAFGQAVYAVSDERLKENIRDYDKGLADIVKLKPRLFDWKEGEGSNEKNVSGFIAQECEAAGFDEFVGDFKHDTLTDAKSFGQSGLIPALVKAIQEQQEQIESLQQEIEVLKNGN